MIYCTKKNQFPDKNKNRKISGSTFISVLIGIVLLAGAAVPLLTTLVDQTRATQMSKMRIFAHQLACNMIERFRTERYSQIKVMLDAPESGEMFVEQDELLNPSDVNSRYHSQLARYSRMVILSSINSNMGVLEVYVDWVEDGRPRQISMSTVLVDVNFPGGRPY